MDEKSDIVVSTQNLDADDEEGEVDEQDSQELISERATQELPSEQATQELLSKDYLQSQQPDEDEEEKDRDECCRKLAQEQILYDATMKRLDRGNHKCCIVGLQYALDYASIDVEEVINYIASLGGTKTKKTRPTRVRYDREQKIPITEVQAFLHWVQEKTA